MSSDLIYRQDAINAMMVLKREDDLAYGCEIPESFDSNRAIKALKNIPYAEPERKWIPVTEALPEEDEEVLVTVRFDGTKDVKPSVYVETSSQISGTWVSYGDEYKVAPSKHHVIAWMPLPEPWRGE